MDVEQQHKKANSDRKRKRKHKMHTHEQRIDYDSNAVGINNLPDEIITIIMSYMSRNEAARASVLSRRWRYLWKFSSGTLELDDKSIFSSLPPGLVDKDNANKIKNLRKKFIGRVDRVLKLHQGLDIDGLIIRFAHLRSRLNGRRPNYIDRWIYFAMQKKLKIFELDFTMYNRFHSDYRFPKVNTWLSKSHEFGFGPLRSLRLVDVEIEGDVVEYFLASCPYLEQLCIRGSSIMKKLRVVDPLPSLKFLEISNCSRYLSLEISAMSLVSCTFIGWNVTFSEITNLSELTLGGSFIRSFFCEPNQHSSYSDKLVKLVMDFYKEGYWFVPPFTSDLPRLNSLVHLELNVTSPVGWSILVFTLLIKGSPLLREFRINISYVEVRPFCARGAHPQVCSELTSCHENLKVVKMSGYVGCWRDDEFVLGLLEIAPSLETVNIDTESEYYERETPVYNEWGKRETDIFRTQGTGASTRVEAKSRAENLKLRFPPKTTLIVE